MGHLKISKCTVHMLLLLGVLQMLACTTNSLKTMKDNPDERIILCVKSPNQKWCFLKINCKKLRKNTHTMKTTVEILNSNYSTSRVIFILSYVISIILCRSSNSCRYKKRQLGRNNSLRVKELPFSARKYFHKIWTD